MNIEYKNITKKDYKKIKNLIQNAWFTDDYLETKNNKKPNLKVYATGYLYHHLSTSSYTIAAYDNEKLVGFLFGRAEGAKIKNCFINKFKQFLVGIRMLFTKIGRRGLKVYFKEKKIDDSLLNEYDKEKNEICLFIVDEAYRKKGIGSTLEEYFIAYLKNLNKHNLFLYTDSYSNFNYYEKRNYKRHSTRIVQYDNENAEYYIYIKEI